MKVLMNSAMMPREGYYSVKEISKEEFAAKWKMAGKEFYSTIGYPESAKHLTRTLGEYIPINRELTEINDGDLIFVCKLNYRTISPADKRNLTPTESDYMYFIGRYFEEYQSFAKCNNDLLNEFNN